MLFHVWDRTSHIISGDSHRARTVHDFAAAIAILKRNKLIIELSIMTIWVYHLVFVVTGNWSHVMLHRLRLLMLRLWLLMLLRVFMAIYDRRDHIIVMILR